MTAAPTTVEVTTTYLQIPNRAAFRPAPLERPDLSVLEAEEPSAPFYRFLYGAVGRDHRWVDRLAWSDAELEAHLGRPAVTLLGLYFRGTPVGYVELDRGPHAAEAGTQVAYFGLVPAVHGQGFGTHLLSVGVTRAFADGAARVWVHTCTLDGPWALATYRGRGFAPYKTVTEGGSPSLPPPAERPRHEGRPVNGETRSADPA